MFEPWKHGRRNSTIVVGTEIDFNSARRKQESSIFVGAEEASNFNSTIIESSRRARPNWLMHLGTRDDFNSVTAKQEAPSVHPVEDAASVTFAFSSPGNTILPGQWDLSECKLTSAESAENKTGKILSNGRTLWDLSHEEVMYEKRSFPNLWGFWELRWPLVWLPAKQNSPMLLNSESGSNVTCLSCESWKQERPSDLIDFVIRIDFSSLREKRGRGRVVGTREHSSDLSFHFEKADSPIVSKFASDANSKSLWKSEKKHYFQSSELSKPFWILQRLRQEKAKSPIVMRFDFSSTARLPMAAPEDALRPISATELGIKTNSTQDPAHDESGILANELRSRRLKLAQCCTSEDPRSPVFDRLRNRDETDVVILNAAFFDFFQWCLSHGSNHNRKFWFGMKQEFQPRHRNSVALSGRRVPSCTIWFLGPLSFLWSEFRETLECRLLQPCEESHFLRIHIPSWRWRRHDDFSRMSSPDAQRFRRANSQQEQSPSECDRPLAEHRRSGTGTLWASHWRMPQPSRHRASD